MKKLFLIYVVVFYFVNVQVYACGEEGCQGEQPKQTDQDQDEDNVRNNPPGTVTGLGPDGKALNPQGVYSHMVDLTFAWDDNLDFSLISELQLQAQQNLENHFAVSDVSSFSMSEVTTASGHPGILTKLVVSLASMPVIYYMLTIPQFVLPQISMVPGDNIMMFNNGNEL